MADTNILFVDDEKNILGSISRVFRKEDYGILLAESGECALDLLRHNRIAVVVSDQRMPGMGGVEFLKRVREASPDTVRMMLTGQADSSEIAGAINDGGVYRYITKPWDDEELKLVIKAAAERYNLVVENRRLQETTMKQNAELYELNQTLEARVEEKTKKLRGNFFSFVGLCADMIELHDPLSGGHCKRVAVLSRGLGHSLGVKGAELEALWAAALLHEIGLIGVPREVLEKSEGDLLDSERALLRNNPALSQEMIVRIDTLRQTGLVVRSHMEWFDGSGYPDALKGGETNYGSRILSVCSEYDRLRHARRPYSKTEALAVIERGRGRRFDPDIADAFLKFAGEIKDGDENHAAGHGRTAAQPANMKVEIKDIAPGMALAKPLVSGKGRLLVAQGTVLTEALIEKVLNFHRIDPITEQVQVHAHSAA
jgi:response regulator RpfG family c-di-GMP phosphodiesterase